MSHARIGFTINPTLQEFYDTLETVRGQQVLSRVENHFASVADFSAHLTDAPRGALLHFGHGNTLLFEGLPAVTLVGYALDLSGLLGFNIG